MVRIYTPGLPLKSLKIMRNPVSSTTLVSHPFSFFFSSSAAFTREYRVNATEWRAGLLGETLNALRARLIEDRLDNESKRTSVFASDTFSRYSI